MSIILRFTRHPVDANRKLFLRKVYGEDCEIISQDFPYGTDPVSTIKEAIGVVGDVVAIEVIAPFAILMKLVDGRRTLGVTILRAEFRRDGTGRAVVTGKDAEGRDILAFDRYVSLDRIAFEVSELV